MAAFLIKKLTHNNMKNIITENLGIKSLKDSFAIIEKWENVSICTWQIHQLDNLLDLEQLQVWTREKIVFIAPFCLARIEKWYEALWDEKILAMTVENELQMSRDELLALLPDHETGVGERKIHTSYNGFWEATIHERGGIDTDISDKDFWKLVVESKDEIWNGSFNQAIISRQFTTQFDCNLENVLSVYHKLLKNRGQYMTFAFNTPEQLFIWVSPEKHLEIENGNVSMNPIAGTVGKWEFDSFYERFSEFLADEKEIGELAMVIDEELKMISKISEGWIIEVPLLKEVWAVIHTEADLKGKLDTDVSMMDAFRETLFAPTLVWGPIESAFAQIARTEWNSRGYYGWAFGTLDAEVLDTAIVIRTAFINKLNSILLVRAWAWIVQDSTPEGETRETVLKSRWFFGALQWPKANNSLTYLDALDDEQKREIEKLLEKRKSRLSRFHTGSQMHEDLLVPEIQGKRFVLIHNGDDFVHLSWLMIQKMWGEVDIISNKDFDVSTEWEYDAILLWPWYGNINDSEDPKMTKLMDITHELIERDTRLLWICLGHQAICKAQWYSIEKQDEISQWTQINVEIEGVQQTLWFYNSFSPVIQGNETYKDIDVFMDNGSFGNDRVLNYRATNISSTQSHPESIMSINGFEILRDMILHVLK